MSKKNHKKTNKQVGTEKEVREFIKTMVMSGEVLGNQIAEMLSQYGSSMSGLLLETYAMAKAWAALKAIAKSKGFEAEELFERVVPSFAEEMESIVNEAAGQK